MYRIKDLFDLEHTEANDYLQSFTNPSDALDGIKDLILNLIPSLDKNEYKEVSPDVWVHETAVIYPGAYFNGPAIIGPETEVRVNAFIRGNALVGKGCVVGNSTELKNVILFDGVQVPHFNYVGDSILGYKAHMGAGAVTSNVKADKTHVVIRQHDEEYDTGRKKVGAFLGDYADIGCNSVLNPGTVIGRRSSVYPTSSVRGTVEEDSIYKAQDNIIKRR